MILKFKPTKFHVSHQSLWETRWCRAGFRYRRYRRLPRAASFKGRQILAKSKKDKTTKKRNVLFVLRADFMTPYPPIAPWFYQFGIISFPLCITILRNGGNKFNFSKSRHSLAVEPISLFKGNFEIKRRPIEFSLGNNGNSYCRPRYEFSRVR